MPATIPKNHLKSWLAEAVVVILALVALRKDNPYPYYLVLRWIACPLFGWIAWKAFSKVKSTPLAVVSGMMAIIYNPILRVMLDRHQWEVLNMAMIAVAVWSAILNLKPSHPAN